MRKLIFGGILLMGSFTAFAEYDSMEFKFHDGSNEVISAVGLVINIDGENLTITNNAGVELKMDASSLYSMQFIDTSGVKALPAEDSPVKVYNLNGGYMGDYENINAARISLVKGVYVVRNQEGETIKMVIGK